MKLLKLKSGLYKKILGVFGAAGFLVTFQACYGTPQNYVEVNGCVKDADTEEGVSNLQISVYSEQDSVTLQTDENGFFNQSIIAEGDISVKILDVDGENNGTYSEFDTVLISEEYKDYHSFDVSIHDSNNDLNIEE